MKDLLLLAVVILCGWFYYLYSTSRNGALKQYAFFIKIGLLVLSFVLALIEQDFIIVGTLSFGGKTSVMMLIAIEIADAFADRRQKK